MNTIDSTAADTIRDTTPQLTQYELFALHCMPKLQDHIIHKLHAHGVFAHTILSPRVIQHNAETLRKCGYYIHYAHTSPRQIVADIASRTTDISYTLSRRCYPSIDGSPEIKVAVITRNNVPTTEN